MPVQFRLVCNKGDGFYPHSRQQFGFVFKILDFPNKKAFENQLERTNCITVYTMFIRLSIPFFVFLFHIKMQEYESFVHFPAF